MVDEATNIAFHTIFLRFSIFQLSQCNLGKSSLKDDCVRSCLIELQSFFDDSKININSEYRVLMPFPTVLYVSGMSRFRVVNVFWISVIFVSWINRQEEHCLTSAQNLTSKNQSIFDNRVKIECASYMVNVRKYSRSNQHVILQRKINDTVTRMSLKSTEIND